MIKQQSENAAARMMPKRCRKNLGQRPRHRREKPLPATKSVRTRLFAVGRWIRTFGSWSRNRKTDHGRRDCFLKNASGSAHKPSKPEARETDSLLEGDGFEPSVPRRDSIFSKTVLEPGDNKPARQPEPDFDDRQGLVSSPSVQGSIWSRLAAVPEQSNPLYVFSSRFCRRTACHQFCQVRDCAS